MKQKSRHSLFSKPERMPRPRGRGCPCNWCQPPVAQVARTLVALLVDPPIISSWAKVTQTGQRCITQTQELSWLVHTHITHPVRQHQKLQHQTQISKKSNTVRGGRESLVVNESGQFIYYKSLTWFKAIFCGIHLLFAIIWGDLGWGRCTLPRMNVNDIPYLKLI